MKNKTKEIIVNTGLGIGFAAALIMLGFIIKYIFFKG